jgi:ABC-2 type transport system ATP-binding protein
MPNPDLSFEIHLTEHCNLNCKGCFHFSCIAEEEYLTKEEFERDISRISELSKGVVKENKVAWRRAAITSGY